MAEAVYEYFKAHKKDSLYYIALGFVSLSLAVFFLSKGHPYFNGLAYVLVTTGLMQLTSGMTHFLRSDMDRVSVAYFIEKDIERISDREIPRMKLLVKEHVIFCKVEMGCVVLGLLFWTMCSPVSLGKGIGLALTVQATVMLVFDYLVIQRANVYLNFLQSLKPKS